MTGRVLAWFSCGDASAVAAKLAVEKYGERCEILYCDTFAYEHPDNRRFFADIERWVGREIRVLRSDKYSDIYDVFRRTKWLIGPKGARCTTELKKNVRTAYQHVDDVHVFGYTVEESHRKARFFKEEPYLQAQFPLIEAGITKAQCHQYLRDAGIELPAMYKLGYRNNNCIGCVKGGLGYWNKVRKDFPEIFAKMARTEREMNVAINKTEGIGRKRQKLFLDELPPELGNYDAEGDIECGVLCFHPVGASP